MSKYKVFLLRQYKKFKNEGFFYFLKVIKIILTLYVPYFLILLLLPVLVIFRNFFNIKFIGIDASRMGHFATQFEPYMREIYLKNRENKIKNNFLIYMKKPISNYYLKEIYLEFIKNNKNIYYAPGFFIWELIIKVYTKIISKDIVANNILADDFYNYYHEKPTLFTILKKDLTKGQRLLEKFNIPNDSKIICVHNRDKHFLKKRFSKIDFDYHNYRDFSINELKPTLEYFAENNYYVVRFGSNVEERLCTKNPKIIDYATDDSRNDFGDIFFNYKCKFYFGSDSGAWNISRMFRKPGFIINACPLASIFVMKWNYPSIFKRFKDIRTNKYLSLQEIVDKNLIFTSKSSDFLEKNVKLISNSSLEILDFAKEVLSIFEKKNKKDLSYEKKLNSFHAILLNNENMKKRYYKNLIGEKFLKNTLISNSI